MSIHIGDHNRFTNVTIAEKIDHELSKKTFAERHPIWIGLFCSFVVGVVLLFGFWSDVVVFIESLFS